MSVDPGIFRAYDIRGIVDESLTELTVELIGKAIGSAVLDAGERALITARDGRLSGPRLMAAFQAGVLSTGCDVIDLGDVPTPVLYYATCVLATHSGIVLTGSHNPPNYNGIKVVIAGETWALDQITSLYTSIVHDQFHSGQGQKRSEDIVPRYIERIASDVQITTPMKVVLDAGNGIAGKVAPELFERLGCEVIPLYCEVDGHFPNHHPDPTRPENIKDMVAKVKETGADVGFGFDGDGDRLGVVTNTGKMIWADRQMMLFAQSVLASKPGAEVVYDVKCSQHLDTVIREAGGRPLMYKTGHALLKKKLKEAEAALAGEMSGHIFFNDRWYGFDDGLYTGARLLEILAQREASADDVFASIPEAVSTPEIHVQVTDENKFDIVDTMVSSAEFPGARKITIDGLRVAFDEGWALVRASNTTPCLVCRFEADTEEALDRIQAVFNSEFKRCVGLEAIG